MEVTAEKQHCRIIPLSISRITILCAITISQSWVRPCERTRGKYVSLEKKARKSKNDSRVSQGYFKEQETYIHTTAPNTGLPASP
jgi:hypothetical protein